MLKKSANLKEMTWIRIHFFPVRIHDSDPDPHENKMDPKRWLISIMILLWILRRIMVVKFDFRILGVLVVRRAYELIQDFREL